MPTPDEQPVIALYERWVKAGPPPLGVSLARWWDRRLVELRDAIVHRNDANNADESARTTPENAPTSSDAPDNLRRFRVWLAAEYDKADAADRTADVPPELMIRPYNGIAAGIAIALHGIDCMLRETRPAHDAGPTVAECRRDDLRWDVEQGGE
jgi:hypothetical protein